ncbi:DUF3006 domain-containing protein [Thermosediminibacter litoriperuensis]|uniref:DUF3006 family protein n=1 Tax=Thermosediminibacter litoriperuensis TaxID=291989 RepID=A0A5S5AUW4_9FIRM|nr:DUF3006 domain-containing protein [Thermosediminibacter litoriperuensis]TYP56686.1 Protein of unknown function (DUF3006) [Thermosediminibacter litoriperuensis]
MVVGKKGVIDRFEGEFAVIETTDGKIINIKKHLLPERAREGDVIDLENLTIDEPETRRRKREIEEMARYLFED